MKQVVKYFVFSINCVITFFVIPNFVEAYIYPETKTFYLILEKIGISSNIFLWIFITFYHFFIFVLCNSFIYIFYWLEHPYFEKYKTHENPWPWKENNEVWIVKRNESFKTLFINQFIVVPIAGLTTVLKSSESNERIDKESFPSVFEMITQILFCIICEDFLFYWSHRLLHTDFFYEKIHKTHHEYKNVVSFTSENAHVLEFIFGNALPSNLAPILLKNRMHCFTKYLWLFIRVAKTTEAHSGYQFPWSPFLILPFSAPSDFHNYHHRKFKGNYGSFFCFWDKMCGTESEGYSTWKLKWDKNLDEKIN